MIERSVIQGDLVFTGKGHGYIYIKRQTCIMQMGSGLHCDLIHVSKMLVDVHDCVLATKKCAAYATENRREKGLIQRTKTMKKLVR